jgi:flagellar hook-associated protein 1 FlgK
MSGLIGAMNTALTGLKAFETGIGVVSQNLTNITTPGYGVEAVDLATAIGTAGQPGSGVLTPVVSRAADGFSAGLLRGATSSGSAAGAQATALTGISNALQNNGDIQTAINQFFLDIGTLASDPTSQAKQQTVLSDAQTVTSTFQSAAASLAGNQTSATTGLSQGVTQANSLLTQLATINKSLQANPNSPTLLDQQETALNTLSTLLPVNVLPQAGGQVLVTTGGTVLLDQSGAQAIALSTSPATAPVLTTGNPPTTLTLSASGGTLGANIQAWQSGAQATQALNGLAGILATNVNSAQAQGLTSTGAQGGALFSVPAPTALAANGNTGTAALSAQVTNGNQLAVNGGPFTVSYHSATGWSAANQTSGQTYTLGTGNSLAFAGLTVAVSGAAANGDSFTVNPAPGAAAAFSVAATNPNQIASADPYVATPGTLQSNGSIQDNNGGTSVFGTDIVTSTPASGAAIVPAAYYGQTLQINFTSATAYNVSTAAAPGTPIASGTLVGGATNVAVAYPAGAASGDYWQLPVSAAPAAGDTVTLSPGGSSSGSNATRLAGLWTAQTGVAGASLQQSVVGFTTSLGANAQAATQRAAATASQVTTATANLQAIAGVSSDQQAVVLTGYSQAYQAAAQVISTAHTMFESLLTDI